MRYMFLAFAIGTVLIGLLSEGRPDVTTFTSPPPFCAPGQIGPDCTLAARADRDGARADRAKPACVSSVGGEATMTGATHAVLAQVVAAAL